MPQRTGHAQWTGDLRGGSGRLQLGSGAFEGNYSFGSRFESAAGTNPEELIAAAHAACFAMATASGLGKAGFKPENISTKAVVHLDSVSGSFKIARIDLDLEADVPNIDDKAFQQIAQAAKQNCPVSQALAAVPEITLKARLRQKAR